MSFLDNLENALNSAERQAEREDAKAANQSRAAEMEALRAIAPHAEALKKSPWTQGLLNECVKLGHGRRVRVGMAWIGPALRLDAREKRLELQPVATGIEAIFLQDGTETGREGVDMTADPALLAQRWLGEA